MQLKEEQEGIVARHGDTISRQVLSEMKYAEAVVREALRLKGPATLLMKCAHCVLIADCRPVDALLRAACRTCCFSLCLLCAGYLQQSWR